MSSVVVAVTEKEYRKAEPVFAATAGLKCRPAPVEENELASAIRAMGARHAIVGALPYVGPLYSALPPGGVVARFGVGHDGIDKPQATAAGLLCTNTPGVLDQSVAEHTILLLLAAARHFPSASAAAHNGTWTAPPGQELAGKNLAVIGWGPIGRAVSRIAALGFQMRVVGSSRNMHQDADTAEFTTDFARAVRDADFVSLHIPAVPATAKFLNAQRLALLRPHAWVINTARGSVVDEAALAAALRAGQIAGAALDVFEREPYTPTSAASDLRQFENVIMTPHVASNTTEANYRMAERAVHNILLAEAGKWASMDLLNPAVLERTRS